MISWVMQHLQISTPSAIFSASRSEVNLAKIFSHCFGQLFNSFLRQPDRLVLGPYRAEFFLLWERMLSSCGITFVWERASSRRALPV